MSSPQEHRGATPTQSFRFSLLSESVSCQRPIFLKLKKKNCGDHQILSARLHLERNRKGSCAWKSSQVACPAWSPTQNVSLVASVITFLL